MNNKPSIETQPLFWLELLGDGELSVEERKSVWSFLETHPGHWKQCAMTLWDAQTLKSDLKNAVVEPNNKPNDSNSLVAPAGRLRIRQLALSTCLAASLAFVLGCAAYPLLFGKSPVMDNFESVVQTDDAADSEFHDENNFGTTAVSRRIENMSQRFSMRPNSLVEIENTPSRAVYYLDHRLPDFLLEAMIRAGHHVSISQEFVEIDGPNEEKIKFPFITLVINKYANLGI